MKEPSLLAACFASALLAACETESSALDASTPDAALGYDAAPAVDAALDDDASIACTSGTLTHPALVAAARRSPDGKGWCCQASTPTCDCGQFGGFVENRCQCGDALRRGFGVCDLAPPDWILETDTHGCAVYHMRVPTTACCNCQRPPDASVGGGS